MALSQRELTETWENGVFAGCAYRCTKEDRTKTRSELKDAEIPFAVLSGWEFTGIPVPHSHAEYAYGKIIDSWRDRFGGVHIMIRITDPALRQLVWDSLRENLDTDRALSIGHDTYTYSDKSEKYVLREVSICHRNARYGSVINNTMTPHQYKVYTQSSSYTTSGSLSDPLNALHLRRALALTIMSGEAQHPSGSPSMTTTTTTTASAVVIPAAGAGAAPDLKSRFIASLSGLPDAQATVAIDALTELHATNSELATQLRTMQAAAATYQAEKAELEQKLATRAGVSDGLDAFPPDLREYATRAIKTVGNTLTNYMAQIQGDPRDPTIDSEAPEDPKEVTEGITKLLYRNPNDVPHMKTAIRAAFLAGARQQRMYEKTSAPAASGALDRLQRLDFTLPSEMVVSTAASVGGAAAKRQHDQAPAPIQPKRSAGSEIGTVPADMFASFMAAANKMPF
jgi:hypothetical protein